ncbi:DEAD/DEAH box helicase [Falsiroseomonas tokyonensis]|uniref:DEAD/DEAH box helicase n=2 Tax=Falsiroseomonas tokyonensis TaxID=430521 RepID=A0ABV7BNP6_9PROT|nr:DEAD/DEAH box helicase [Falsiroseomonas tokyonensis]
MTSSRSDLARMMPDAFPVFFTGRQPYAGQAMVMPEVVRGHNVLFAAPTASGKTEAAVTPLYQRHITFKRRDLSTIYVAPTKALVNDLYERLVTYLETRQAGAVARYTGDRHEFRTASGAFCLLVTPEALDSLQLRRPETLSGVRAVIVDEIHLLHGQPRGQQLRHVIARIRKAAAPSGSPRDRFQLVGMTATLDDMAGVAETWLGAGAKVLSHGASRDIELQFVDIDADGDPDRERAGALARWLQRAAAEKVLVFANSRNGAHGLAAHLHRELEGTRWPVHLHFGALAATERERVEDEMRRKRYGVCVATTTLEIGIDIGDVDTVVLSDPPRSVSGFLQRIGRGNRRSDVCRVVAFRATENDERLIRALVDCGRRGELDDIHEYDRPSVRFQQILSLCWRATRQDRPLSAAALCAEAGADDHKAVINDMVETGCLADVRGALIPCDRLMDEADAGQIHTVIASRVGSAVVDIRTGKTAIRDADESTAGGAIFHGGSMRRLLAGSEGGAYLGGAAARSQSLARIKGTGPALPVSRSVIWGLARQRGFDPVRWHLSGAELVTWGGETYNTLLGALFARQLPDRRFAVTPDSVAGPVHLLDVSLDFIRELARSAEEAGDLPLSTATKFTSPSRYLNELSPRLAALEKRSSIPWKPFWRWLDRIEAIDQIGSMPPTGAPPGADAR